MAASGHGHHGGHHWKHRHWGYYGGPVYVSAPVRTCYFAGRYGTLVKICSVPVYY